MRALTGIAGRETTKRRAWLAVASVTALAATALAAFAFTARATGAVAAAATVTPQTTQGTDFWLTFEGNNGGGSNLYLFAAGDTATSGTVSEPGIEFSQSFTVTPGTVTQVTLPSNGQDVTSDTVGNYGIHVTATAPVSIYGLNTVQYTTDGFLGLPTDILGQHYIVEAYTNDIGTGSQFSVVGTADGTNVTIVPSETVGSHPAGTPYTVQLNQGQTYQLNDAAVANGDLTGTDVTSDKPVAVFGGNSCAYVPAQDQACNTLAEELPPVTAWGTSFVTEPLATRSADTFRFLASADNTTVQVNGTTVATLNAHAFYETTLSAASVITSNNPILVTQFSNGSQYDNTPTDPFSVTVPPYGQFLNSYTVTTEPNGADPAISANYVNVVAPASEVGSVTLDGTAIPASDFKAIPGSSFSGAQVAVPFGSHVLGGPLPFGITVYGFGNYDGYGYPGGFTLSPIAVVSKVTLALTGGGTAPVGGTATATATVTDQNGSPLQGVRADFTVTGANAQTGFAYTDASGHAVFTYTGKNAGSDTITAAVQSITSSPVTWTWTQSTTPTAITTKLAGDSQVAAKITLPAGQPAVDTAVLTAKNVATATGGVTYRVYSDAKCTTLVATAGTAKVITGRVGHSSPEVLAAGTYYWTASYSGDAANAPSVSSCGSEVLTVIKPAGTPGTVPSVDSETTAFSTSTVTAHSSTNLAGDLIVAFVAAQGPGNALQTSTVSGGGLTWYLISRQNPVHTDTEVWVAIASGKLTNASITAVGGLKGFDEVISLVAFKNATGVGPESFASATSGAPHASLTTAAAITSVYAIGADWKRNVAHTPGTGQSIVATVNAPGGHAIWVQRANSATSTAGTAVTINDTSPVADPYNLLLVGIQ